MDFEDLGVVLFDLSAELKQVLILLLSASGVLVLAVIGELVDLQAVVSVLARGALLLQSLDRARAHVDAVGGHALLLLGLGCLHRSLHNFNYNQLS